MTVMWCPECEKQRVVKALGGTAAITHNVERKYECTACGLLFEKPVGIWRRNRKAHNARPSRQVFEIQVSPRK